MGNITHWIDGLLTLHLQNIMVSVSWLRISWGIGANQKWHIILSEWFLFNWCKTHLLSHCIKTNACDASGPKTIREVSLWYVLYNYFSKDSGLPWTLYPLSWMGHFIEINCTCSALLDIWYYFTSTIII